MFPVPLFVLRYVLPALAVLGLFWGVYYAGGRAVQKKWDAAVAAQNLAAARDSLRRSEANLGVGDAYAEQERKLQQERLAQERRLSDANFVVGRLRDQLLRKPDAPASAACGVDEERNRVLRGLFAEGLGLAGEVDALAAEGRARVGSLDAKVTALQAYIDKVCK